MTTSNYTTLLGLALPTTGDLSGQWGNEVNSYITEFLDTAVAGSLTITGDVTLTKTTGTSLGATSSQYAVLITSGLSANTTVTAPAASKVYIVNNTSSLYTLKIRGAGPTTGVTLAASEKAVVAWNGSDFVKIASSATDGVSTISFGTTGLTPSTATDGAVTVAGTLVAANGGTGQSSYTTGDLLYATGSTALSKLGIGTNGQILTSTGTAPQWSTLSGVAVTTFSAGTTGFTPSSATSGAVTLAGTLATTNGGTGLTSFTANGVVYASSTSALTTGSTLTFDGATLTTKSVFFATDSQSYFGDNGVIGGGAADGNTTIRYFNGKYLAFKESTSEQMRLTTTGLGIGTSSPSQKLTVNGNIETQNAGYVRSVGTGSDTAGVGPNIGVNSSAAIYYIQQLNASNGLDFWYYNAGWNKRLTLDSSGNLGLGVTPSAWDANGKGLQVGNQLALGWTTPTGSFVGGNAYYGLGWKRIGTGAATAYLLGGDGAHIWYSTSTSGSANSAISFTQAMTLDASGFLGIGQTNPISYLDIYGNGAYTYARFYRSDEAGYGGRVGSGNTLLGAAVARSLGLDGFAGISFGIAGSQVATFNSSGNLGIGTSSPSTKLQVAGTITAGATGSISLYDGNIRQTGASSPLYIGTAGAGFIQFYNNDVNTAVIDTSGNLGLGVTPSAWQGAFDALQFGDYAGIGSSREMTLFANAYQNSAGNGIYQVSSLGASKYDQYNGVHAWYIAPSGTAGNTISFTQAMTLDANGDLGVGTTNPTSYSSKTIQLNGSSTSAAIKLTNSTTGEGDGAGFDIELSSNDINYVNRTASGVQKFWTNSTERARITSDGRVCIGGSTVTDTHLLNIQGSSASHNIGIVLNKTNATAQVWGITNTGPLAFYDYTAVAERLRFATTGAWGLGGANYGTSGQVLTSNGSGSAPTWQNAGGGGSPAGSSGQIQFNNSGAFGATSNFFWDNNNARLGIGTSTPSVKLELKGGNGDQINLNNGGERYTQVTWQNNGTSKGAVWVDNTNSLFEIVGYSGIGLTFQTNLAERARIDTNGTLLINTTARSAFISSSTKLQVNCTGSDYAAYLENTNSTPYGLYIRYGSYAPNGTGSSYIYCDDSSAQRFSVRSNGGVYNYQANDSNLSDRREKTNFAPAKAYLDTICAIPVQTFNYIDQSEDDPGLTLGVVAQDVQAVAPELVQESNWGTKDDPKMRLSIYQTDLQYALMKCIQELKAELDTVKAELATLKGN